MPIPLLNLRIVYTQIQYVTACAHHLHRSSFLVSASVLWLLRHRDSQTETQQLEIINLDIRLIITIIDVDSYYIKPSVKHFSGLSSSVYSA
jgi:hypothetical protein